MGGNEGEDESKAPGDWRTPGRWRELEDVNEFSDADGAASLPTAP
jgi:hypothetical protein